MAAGVRRVLEAVGITEPEERLYRTLLRHPRASAAELARSTGLSSRETRDLMAVLEEKGLVTRSPGRAQRFVPAPPHAAVELLILRRQEELERARVSAASLVEDFRAGVADDTPIELVEMISGRQAVIQRFIQIQRSAKHEVLVFDRPPYAQSPPGSNETEYEMLRRGVSYRAVYDTEALEIPGKLDEIQRTTAAGEQARTFSGLPMKIAIADREIGLLPLRLGEPGTDEVLVVRPSPLLEAITMLFESIWERANPVSLAGKDDDTGGLSVPDRELLILLAGGLKDEAIARQLGVVVRTVERRVRRIMDLADARTRFQAGMQAERRGWLQHSTTSERSA